ncbi:hypothetical protein DV515_00019529 [Chloebia gouldiae]|uniref:Uncharacterized protein n=1 Tax=Chloebia gouldiae TaxID=44316 RepID=A0A3L8Q508_CHLGU|nr:hypothetical protein DV515_00019529 [Chloebia gouldiae]
MPLRFSLGMNQASVLKPPEQLQGLKGTEGALQHLLPPFSAIPEKVSQSRKRRVSCEDEEGSEQPQV